MTDEIIQVRENNLTRIPTRIYVTHTNHSNLIFGISVENMVEIPYKKYQIKETDYRVKTMTLTTNFKFDLTTQPHIIKLVSGLHENFLGIFLSTEYVENSDGTYTYKIQDMSRNYQSKLEFMSTKNTVYRILQTLITRGGFNINDKLTAEKKETWKTPLSGLRPLDLYQTSFGNTLGNTFNQTPKIIIRNTSLMDAIRGLAYGHGDVDVYFDSAGILQIEPISRSDWENTGLHLTADETIKRDFKFDITNVITGVQILSTNQTEIGKYYDYKDLTGLDLTAFFGWYGDMASNPNENVTISAGTTTTTPVTKTKAMKNPFNDKNKKILVSADGGSSSFKSSMVKLLKNDGWTVTDLGVGPGTHSTSYNKLASAYAVNLTIYNGADPATIAEPVTGWLKGKHEKYGVQLVQMFDTKTWTNPKGMKPYRYGNFDGYYCGKAWDDNYSSGNVDIKDLGAWYKKYRKKVLHCCGPSPSEAYNQFKAGGYLKQKGL